MKHTVLAVALCLFAVSLSLGAQKEHWAKRLRKMAQAKSKDLDAELADQDPALKDILKNVPYSVDSFTPFNRRSPYNSLFLSRIHTGDRVEKWRTKLLARWYHKEGPESFWSKLKEQETSMGKSQRLAAAVDLALDQVTTFIDEYQKELNETCSNVNTLTGQMDAPKKQKVAELTATTWKVMQCTKRHMELFNSSYESEDVGIKLALPEIVISTLVHNATRIARSYTDCAAAILALTARSANETCFKEFTTGDTVTYTKIINEMYSKNNQIIELPDKDVIDGYARLVDIFKSPDGKAFLSRGSLSEYVGNFNIKSNNKCGTDLIKSAVQMAIELDMEHRPGSCIGTMQNIANIQLSS